MCGLHGQQQVMQRSVRRCGHTSCGSVTKHASRVIAMDWEGLTEQPSGMAAGGLAQEAS